MGQRVCDCAGDDPPYGDARNIIKVNTDQKYEDAVAANESENADGAASDDYTLRPGELSEMAAQLRRESRTYVLRLTGSVGCWLLSIVSLVAALTSGAPGKLPAAPMLGCLMFIIVGAALVPTTRSRVLEAWKQRPDLCMIGPLVDALTASNGETAAQIRALLTTLLPRLRPADASALTPRQRRSLRDALLLGDADRDPAYLQAVAQALTQCADEQTLLCFTQLAQRGAVTDGQQWVLETILKCLPEVEARLAQKQSGADLLRASSPAPDPAQLLRAAQSAPDTSPHTLLRPDNKRE